MVTSFRRRPHLPLTSEGKPFCLLEVLERRTLLSDFTVEFVRPPEGPAFAMPEPQVGEITFEIRVTNVSAETKTFSPVVSMDWQEATGGDNWAADGQFFFGDYTLGPGGSRVFYCNDGFYPSTGNQVWSGFYRLELEVGFTMDEYWEQSSNTIRSPLFEVIGAKRPEKNIEYETLTPDPSKENAPPPDSELYGDALFEFIARDVAYRENLGVGSSIGSGYTVEKQFGDADGAGFYAIGLTSEFGPSILAFRGTNDIVDIFDDLDPRGIGYAQFVFGSDEIFEWLVQQRNGVSFTGHSLGGALAQWTGATYQTTGRYISDIVTFNSPGISSAFANSFPSFGQRIRHYITEGDLVSMAGEAFLPGQTYFYCSVENPNRL